MTTKLDDLPQVRQFWQDYLLSLSAQERPIDAKVEAAFAGNENTTDALIQLYLDGKKTAGSSLVKDFESAGDALPRVGNYWIALDRNRNPKCILKTIRTVVNRFGDLPMEIARAEGEGDLSVEYWKRTHGEFYSPHLRDWGITRLDDAEVITEYFELVFPRDELLSAVRKFWQLFSDQQWDAAMGMLDESFVADWPQSRERMLGPNNFVSVNRYYPGNHKIRVIHAHRTKPDQVVTTVWIEADTGQKTFANSYFTFSGGGKIVRLEEYWAEPYPAPEWRRQWVEGQYGSD